MATLPDVTALLEKIESNIDALQRLARSDILGVPFETLERIETIALAFYIDSEKLKKLRGAELENVFLAGKLNDPL